MPILEIVSGDVDDVYDFIEGTTGLLDDGSSGSVNWWSVTLPLDPDRLPFSNYVSPHDAKWLVSVAEECNVTLRAAWRAAREG